MNRTNGRVTKAWPRMLVGILVFMVALGTSVGMAQTRMSDKDVEDMRKNLNEDAKKLRSSFNSAVGKSTIRKTQQEKDAKALVERFQKQTEGMLDHFKDKKKVDAELASVRSSADQIDTILTTTQMGDKVQSDWSRVKSQLGTISGAFGMANANQ